MTGAPPAEALDVFGLLEAQARTHPDRVAARSRRGGAWRWSTWGELFDAARAVASALLDRGVRRGDAVALMANTREEWTVVDFAVTSIGAVTVPLYPTATEGRIAHVLADASAVLAVVEGVTELARVHAALGAVPSMREIVVIDPRASDSLDGAPGEHCIPVSSYADLLRGGRAHTGSASFDERRRSASPADVATLVYTSGTTGPPRGVILTHRALLSQTKALLRVFTIGRDDEQLLVLPLAHIFAKVLVLVHVASGSRLAYGDGPNRLTRDLAEVEPTFFATVPRFLEKVYAVANDAARAEGPLKAALWAWAVDVGKRKASRRARGLVPKPLLAAQARYADKLVLARVRNAFGRRLRFVISGAAPLPPELAEWLLACGVTVLEGYGLTELGGASHVNRPGRFRFGTVGQPLPGYEAKLHGDGEVLLRGPSMMQGYRGDGSATSAAVDEDGWLHTGDIGKIDDDGFLAIQDRKKDVIVTAGGSNASPQNIESALLESPWLAHAVVIGDGRPYLVALLTLDEAVCRRWAVERGRPSDLASLAKDPELVALVELDVESVNRRLASYETIKRFTVLPTQFSRNTGELTELGKLRRDVIRPRYEAEIDALYAR
ncbi:MAG TPA: long-chain fatty acid--CoA ligase [Polyangiaceae bacterium]|nr:long-chain fatty acid--CoA ligase [Polyangiaceae bacterium]